MSKGRYGIHGGQYISETLMNELIHLEECYEHYKKDPEFNAELNKLLNEYAGRPSLLYYAGKMTKDLGGAKIYLKREDLNHTGSHKINNALGQALLAKKMGKTRLIAETGAGQHGVATATAAAFLGMECEIFMGKEDTNRQALNVYRMELLGAKVHPVTSGTMTLKDAVNETMREWSNRVEDTHYVLGSVMGPHPFPMIVRDFQSVISQEAKEQIEKAVRIYLMKDEYGDYRIPIERQRPVFLLGAPGIGKTAVMEQIAQEMDIALVSYSMTHHTRQSALGLPFISHKNYGGTEFDVSEYTMSEIVASVYEAMEVTGKTEGILFLDDINCVSETLAPSMLQFLQYKTFGKHQIPQGWVVATAGNPPQFNRSVREFDIVTMDRLKVLEVEADYDTWRKYAVNKGLHGSILTYLDIKKNDFYVIENTVDGKSYVTARGWEDLSETIYLYEENGFTVDEVLVGQYLHNKRIAREFASYYDLYQKYKKDYRVAQILSGNADADVRKRAKNAAFDERISLLGLLLEALQDKIRKNVEFEDALRSLLPVLKELKTELTIDELFFTK